MATKFYLHRDTTADTGTLPGAGVSVGTFSVTAIATGGDTNRVADTTIGVSAQTSIALTTNNVQTPQPSLMLRCVSAPIAAQTLSAQTITLGVGVKESNTNSNFACELVVLAVWRPGTGAIVGYLFDTGGLGVGPGVLGNSTSQLWGTSGVTCSPVTSQDGDILVFELWRSTATQGMSTAYTNTIFYDGTTEASTTNAASYVNFANTVTFASSGSIYTKAGYGKEHGT